jgi:hypothetical protein
MALIVNVINGNVRMLLESPHMTSMDIAAKFPIGEVYARFLEPQGLQWRVLQRGSRIDDVRSFYDAIIPMAVEDLPECVQLVHLCTE